MGALRKIQQNQGTPPKYNRDSENTISIGATASQETTMATVMMTRLYDAKMEVKFNRLLLMGQNDKVTSTYPLNRNITNIGRSRRNHICIKDPLVSVKHLTVSASGNTCVVNDLESSNGTFINGERLVGSRVLKNGEEIMLGKTILRFAARQADTPVEEAKPHQRLVAPSTKKRIHITATALLFVMMSVFFVYLGTHIASQLYPDKSNAITKKTSGSSQPMAIQRQEKSRPPVEVKKTADKSGGAVSPNQTSAFQRALKDYAAGRIESTERTLIMLSTTKEGTPEEHQAKRILSMVGAVKDLHAKARLAQEKKMFAKALDYWDRLLILDMELVGDRPSFFAAQAEQTVQELSYEHALEAYRSKNHQKVRQLCNVILQINPKNAQALTLLAKINSRA